MRACPGRGVHVCGKRDSNFFRSFGQLFMAPLTAALLSELRSDEFHGRLPFENCLSSL
jgi:hypothetical protein